AIENLAIPDNESTLLAPARLIPEDVEAGPAKAAQRSEHPEHAAKPRAELQLPLPAKASQKRGVQVVADSDGPFEGRLQLLLERRREVESCDLVLILVGHKFVEVSRHHLRDDGLGTDLLFSLPDTENVVQIFRRVTNRLILDEV